MSKCKISGTNLYMFSLLVVFCLLFIISACRQSGGPVKDIKGHGESALKPKKIVWSDDFESYKDDTDLFGKGGQILNHWYGLANGNNRGVILTNAYSHSGSQSALIYMKNAVEYGNADLYLKLPLSIVENRVKNISYEGWIAFDNIYDHRLIFMCEVWTGNESHYGQGPDKLIASVVEYNGPTRTWNKEVTDGHAEFEDGYREYKQGMDT